MVDRSFLSLKSRCELPLDWRIVELLMSRSLHRGELQFDDDIEHSRRGWRFKRTCWMLMAMIILASIAGLLGPGPLSARKISDQMLTVEYNRFARRSAPTKLQISFNREQAAREIRLSINLKFLENIELNKISPAPLVESVNNSNVVYTFSAMEGSESRVTIHYKPEAYGATRLEAAIPGQPPIRFQQFVFP
jgi:hypothetical protein